MTNQQPLRVLWISDRPGEPLRIVEQMPGEDRLDFLQTLVDGMIECVSIDRKVDLWVNEEGLYRNDFYVNGIATAYARRQTGYDYTLVGPAIISTTDGRGNTTSVTDAVLAQFNVAIDIWTTDNVRAARITEPA